MFQEKREKYTDSLYNDVQENRKILESSDSQLARRNYLRSLFAFYEIVLSNLRETTAELLVSKSEMIGELNLLEIYPLLDDTSKLSERGQLQSDSNRQSFLPLVAYTLKTYANQIDFDRDVLSDNRWKAFCDSTKIRHRITHPKFDKEIEISDEELKIIDDGWKWWNDILKQLHNAHLRKMTFGNQYK